MLFGSSAQPGESTIMAASVASDFNISVRELGAVADKAALAMGYKPAPPAFKSVWDMDRASRELILKGAILRGPGASSATFMYYWVKVTGDAVSSGRTEKITLCTGDGAETERDLAWLRSNVDAIIPACLTDGAGNNGWRLV